MSEQRQAQDGGRRTPVRMARPTRRSASGPGDRVPSAGDIAGYFREDCRGLRDSLQLEMVVAQYLLRIDAVLTPQGIPVGDALMAGVAAELERHGDPLSHAILRAMAYLAPAGPAADAETRLAARGVGLPVTFGDVAAARALRASRVSEGGRPGEYALFVDFGYPLGTEHSVAVFIVPRRGGVVKHLALMSATAGLDLEEAFGAGAPERVGTKAALELTRAVLERSYGVPPTDPRDFRVLIAAARAR